MFRADGSTGNVGIGTTSPGYLLDLSKTAVSVDTYSGINLQASNYGYTIEGGLTQNIGGELIFSSNNAGSRNERVRFSASGNVGIGTSNPLAKLDVQGTQGQLFSVTDDLSGDIFSVADISGVPIMNVNSDGTSYFDGNVGIGTTSPATYLQIGDYVSNNIDITTYPAIPSEHMIHLTAPETTNRYGGGISFGENAFTAANITVQDAGGNGSLHLLFGTRNTSGTVAERMRITNAGNVGIGTTSPTDMLDVNGTSIFRRDLTIYHKGNNSAPSYELRFKGTNSSGVDKVHASLESSPYNSNTNAGTLLFKTANASNQILDTRMVIDGVGNVGIGTTSPGAKLHVDGTAIFDTQTGAQPFYITRDGVANQALKIHTDDVASYFTTIQDETTGNYGSMVFTLDDGAPDPFYSFQYGTSALESTLTIQVLQVSLFQAKQLD
jgi:hypothetical protein